MINEEFVFLGSRIQNTNFILTTPEQSRILILLVFQDICECREPLLCPEGGTFPQLSFSNSSWDNQKLRIGFTKLSPPIVNVFER